MLMCDIVMDGHFAHVRIKKPSFGLRQGHTLEDAFQRLGTLSARGILFDLSDLKKVSYAALGGLVELCLRLERERMFRAFPTALAVCGLPKKTLHQIKAQGIDRILPIFDTIESVMKTKQFRALQLRGTRAIVLCAEQGSRLAPLTKNMPVALLDYLGRPMIERVMAHAAQFGLHDFVLNPGYCAEQMTQFARAQNIGSVFCVHEGSWQNERSNDVATLRQLHCAHSLFDGDTFVLRSNVQSNLDLGAMMKFHRDSGADATVAVAKTPMASACNALDVKAEDQASAILFSASAAEAIGSLSQIGRETCLVPAMRAAQLNVQLFVSNHQSAPILCGSDYYTYQVQSLENGMFGIRPEGVEIAPNVWAARDAILDRKVTIEGASFVGPQARIAHGSLLKGCNLVGANCIVERNSVLSNSILVPETQVGSRTFVDHMIAGPDWAVSHRFANGSLQNRAKLKGISGNPQSDVAGKLFSQDLVKTA